MSNHTVNALVGSTNIETGVETPYTTWTEEQLAELDKWETVTGVKRSDGGVHFFVHLKDGRALVVNLPEEDVQDYPNEEAV